MELDDETEFLEVINKPGYDWRLKAVAYGPFASSSKAEEHLDHHHQNPGGIRTVGLDDPLQNKYDKILWLLKRRSGGEEA